MHAWDPKAHSRNPDESAVYRKLHVTAFFPLLETLHQPNQPNQPKVD